MGQDLDGRWRAHGADEELRRRYADPGFDDASWTDLPVPSHWQTHPTFRTTDGPILFRRHFTAPTPGPASRVWLELDGVFAQSDVFLDGAYLGDTEGYFFRHDFEVTEPLHLTNDHVLAMEVVSDKPTDPSEKRSLTGCFDEAHEFDDRWNAGGIWRPVRLSETGLVRIRHFRCLCVDVNPERALVGLRTVLDAERTGPVVVATTIERPDGDEIRHERVRQLAAGENRVEWEVEVAEPELWWPRALGEPAFHRVTVEVRVDGSRSDDRTVRTGLRTVELRNWIAHINGERLFLKGASVLPTQQALGEATGHEVAADVERAADANLDLLRVHSHVARPELYDAADEAGLLIWQDFPLRGRYGRSVLGQARRQAREMVDLLGHHPSIMMWCAHAEPIRGTAAQQLPTWNTARLDPSIRRVLNRVDGSRPVIPHSGALPTLPRLDGTDTQLWLGWSGGPVDQLGERIALIPRLGRFVGGFGAQAPPDEARFCDPERWPDLDWPELASTYSLDLDHLAAYAPPLAFRSFDEWVRAAQAHQAEVIAHHIETLRRLKYRPCGGFTAHLLADSAPGISMALLDHRRRPKAGYQALVAACRPVIAVSDPLPAVLHPGDSVVLAVHVVNDLRTAVDDVVAEARVQWPGGGHHQRWLGAVEADGCERIGVIRFTVPEAVGPVTLTVSVAPATTATEGSFAATERRHGGRIEHRIRE